MNTTHTPSMATLTPTWYVVDAKGQRLGRLATAVARVLRGKDKPIYTPFLDTGDYVIVVNAKDIEVTGKKRSQKLYRRHSGRPGGMKVETFAQLNARLPERIIEEAVRGMLPKNRLGRTLFTKLRVYPGPDHPHEAQQPQVLPLEGA
jgi:large subunit ribosomal protein L13